MKSVRKTEENDGCRGISQRVSAGVPLEQRYAQAQKMETMGELAGGIAHDFNNLLTAIIGYQYLLLPRLKDDAKSRLYAEQVTALAEKAAVLTKSLLTFSRKQPVHPRPVDLNGVIRDTTRLLKRLIGEDIELRTLLPGEVLPVMVVAGQVEQVLMNLVTNARDAMPRGGVLTVEAGTTEAGEQPRAEHGRYPAGRYARISVSDTGTGMDVVTMDRIFEPFFTTKGEGDGTGLGLAMVQGIVERHGGHIRVESEPGRGSTFHIYLPIIGDDVREEAPRADESSPPRGNETLLLAEDEKTVRELMRSLLERHGYRVIEAVDGDQALERYQAHEGEIDALIVDVVMPKRNGKEVFDIISKASPGIKTLFISGYTHETIGRKGIGDGVRVVTKPLIPNEFLKTLRQLLG